jgi:hypothetical protein
VGVAGSGKLQAMAATTSNDITKSGIRLCMDLPPYSTTAILIIHENLLIDLRASRNIIGLLPEGSAYHRNVDRFIIYP